MTAVKQGINLGAKSGSGGGGAGALAGQLLASPEILSTLLALLKGLLGREPKQPAPTVKPGGKPRPNPNATDADFPDDVIGAPPSAAGRKVTTVAARFIRAQYGRNRNPEMYTAENPQGLYPNPRGFEGGKDAINIGAKGWLDATAYDQDGVEFLRDAVVAADLQYRTEHHVGEAFIKGNGGKPGEPATGYQTNDTEQVGNGISAWISSMGFLHQVKFHAEGEHDVFVVVGGVESNHFRIRVD